MQGSPGAKISVEDKLRNRNPKASQDRHDSLWYSSSARRCTNKISKPCRRIWINPVIRQHLRIKVCNWEFHLPNGGQFGTSIWINLWRAELLQYILYLLIEAMWEKVNDPSCETSAQQWVHDWVLLRWNCWESRSVHVSMEALRWYYHNSECWLY